jgi:Ala-tRNA(Pro) deacylase
MIPERLKKYLDDNNIRYEVIPHSVTYTAQETAESSHISGQNFAKTVMLMVDGKYSMAALPASMKVDIRHFRELLHTDMVVLAREEDFSHMFPDYDTGAMPPFGNLNNMEVYVDKSLTEDEMIAFNAGNHNELIKMAYKDFEKLVQPQVLDLAVHAK